jgi:hypothetical protein
MLWCANDELIYGMVVYGKVDVIEMLGGCEPFLEDLRPAQMSEICWDEVHQAVAEMRDEVYEADEQASDAEVTLGLAEFERNVAKERKDYLDEKRELRELKSAEQSEAMWEHRMLHGTDDA